MNTESERADQDACTRRDVLARVGATLAALTLPACDRAETHINPAELLLTKALPFPKGVQVRQAVKCDSPLATVVSISVPSLDEIIYRDRSITPETERALLAKETFLPQLGDALAILQLECGVREVWVPGYTRRAESPENREVAAVHPRYRADFVVSALRQRFGDGMAIRGGDDPLLSDTF